MALVTITGNVKVILGLPAGTTFSSGTVRFMLVLPPRVNLTPTLAATGLSFPTQVDVPVNADGSFSVQLQGNDGVIPADTVYTVMYLVPNQKVVPQFFNITGDGASHTVKLQFKTSNAADSAVILNSSATLLPTMNFILAPSN